MENQLLSLLALIVLSLATYRITRFFLFDSLISEPREAFHDWLANKRGIVSQKALELTSCSWCFGWWVALVVYCVYIWSNPTDFTRFDWLSFIAVAGLSGLLHAWEPSDED